LGDGAYTALWLVNAAALAAGELALVVLCEELFPDRRVALFAAALLALCPQPILFTSFLYGNLPGFAAMLWACVLTCRLLNGGRPRLVIGIAILCALGVVLKSNNWIGVAAIVLTLLISLPERFRPASSFAARRSCLPRCC
jgi:predicted membrane-bound mannosyltransferase